MRDAPPEAEGRRELEAAQKAGTEWVRGVTALLGLFSLSGLVFGKDVVTNLDQGGKVAFGVAALVALVAAALSIFFGYHSAYGWPSASRLLKDDKTTLGLEAAKDKVSPYKIYEWSNDVYVRAYQSVIALRCSVALAFLALAALAVAVGVVLFA